MPKGIYKIFSIKIYYFYYIAISDKTQQNTNNGFSNTDMQKCTFNNTSIYILISIC